MLSIIITSSNLYELKIMKFIIGESFDIYAAIKGIKCSLH